MPTQSPSPRFAAYAECLRELDALDNAGLNDSPEADAVRDRADGHWRGMTEAERLAVRATEDADV